MVPFVDRRFAVPRERPLRASFSRVTMRRGTAAVVVVALGLWATLIVWTLDPEYRVEGTVLVANSPDDPPSRGNDVGVGFDHDLTPDSLASILRQRAQTLTSGQAARGVMVDVVRIDRTFVGLRVRAPESSTATQTLTSMVEDARNVSKQRESVAVHFRSNPALGSNEDVVEAQALLEVGPATDLRWFGLPLDYAYLGQLSELLLENTERRAKVFAGVPGDLSVEPVPWDVAPVLQISVTGESPAEARATFDRALVELSGSVDEIQAAAGIRPTDRAGIVLLRSGDDVAPFGESLVPNFFLGVLWLFVVCALAGVWLERVATGAVPGVLGSRDRHGSPERVADDSELVGFVDA